MKKTMYFCLALMAFLSVSCQSNKNTENTTTSETTAPQSEEVATVDENDKTETTTQNTEEDLSANNAPLVSKNFYGNGITEYLLINGQGYFYWNSKRAQKIKLNIFDTKENAVDGTGVIITGKMQFPNDSKVYTFVQDESGLTLTHPDGKTQEYELDF